MCTPKGAGGLGLQKMVDFNLALLGKLAWQMIWCPNKFWVRVMHDKYVKNGSLFTTVAKATDSKGWKSIIRGRSVLELGARWQIGNGKTVDFWSDWWVGDKPLGLVHGVPEVMRHVKVGDFMTANKVWDEGKLAMLPVDVVREIQAIPIAMEEDATDRLG